MKKQIKDLLAKYSYIEFTNQNDKEIFIDFLIKLSNEIDENNQEEIKDLYQIIEYSFIKYTSFNKEILYNPIELIETLIEKDFFGKKIDETEVGLIIKKMQCFEKYINGKLEEKNFLENKYGIKIKLIKEDVFSVSAGIFGKGLNNFHEIELTEKIKKLLDFYPITYIKNIKLDSIIIVNNFYKKDIYGTEILLGGFETHSDNNIYLSRNNLLKSFDHELYHQAMEYYDDFDEWFKIRKRQKKKYLYKNIDKQVSGFARSYGKENVAEDQATVAEELILNYYSLQKRIKSDKKLNLKVKLVKKAFLKLSNGIVNEKWWIQNHK